MDENYFYDERNATLRTRAPATRAMMAPPPSTTRAPVSTPFQPVQSSPFQPVQSSPFQPTYGQPNPFGYPPANPQYAPVYQPAYPSPYNMPPPYPAPAYPNQFAASYPPYGYPYGMPAPYNPAPGSAVPTAGLLTALGGTGGILALGKMAVDLYAASRKLPTPPVATNDVATNVANLIAYTTNLASEAKKVEQLHTAAAQAETVGKLLQ